MGSKLTQAEGLVLGVGAKLFTISGPVLVYGIVASMVCGGAISDWHDHTEQILTDGEAAFPAMADLSGYLWKNASEAGMRAADLD